MKKLSCFVANLLALVALPLVAQNPEGMGTKEGHCGSHLGVTQGQDPVPVWGPLREMGANSPLAKPGEFSNHTFKDGSTSLPYNLYVPEGYDRNKSYPLVVFVHDAGRIGDDPLASAKLEGAKAWTTPRSQAQNPCFVLAPQYGSETGSISRQDLTLHLIQAICKEFSIDTRRIYGTGQSMGCMQSMEMAMEHPDLFAACLLVSGQLDPEKCDALADKELWIVVSEDDQRAFPGMTAVTQYLKGKGAGVAYASIPAGLPQEDYQQLADSLIATGANIKYVSLKAGTLPEEELSKFKMGPGPRSNQGNPRQGDSASTRPISAEGAMAHMASFDVIYRIDAFRNWIFTQMK